MQMVRNVHACVFVTSKYMHNQHIHTHTPSLSLSLFPLPPSLSLLLTHSPYHPPFAPITPPPQTAVPTPSPTSPAPVDTSGDDSFSTVNIIIIAVVVPVGILICAVLAYFVMQERKRTAVMPATALPVGLVN